MEVKKFSQFIKKSDLNSENAQLSRNIQKKLIELGYLDNAPEDPVEEDKEMYANMLRAAILAYQAEKDMRCDGKISKELLKSLMEE